MKWFLAAITFFVVLTSLPSEAKYRPRRHVVVEHRTVIIHEHHDSGSGLATGLVIGSLMSQHQQPAAQPVVVQQSGDWQLTSKPEPHGFLFWVFWCAVACLGIVVLGMWLAGETEEDDPPEDGARRDFKPSSGPRKAA